MAGLLNGSEISKTIFDFIIVGSGFGGSVSAMRLAQKGYSVAVLEKGLRYSEKDFPESNWNLKKFLWAPLFKCFGIQQISLLKGVMVLHGAGVGGGSLVYANTLLQPSDEVLNKHEWPEDSIWRKKLKSNFTIAIKMLGVTQNKKPTLADAQLKTLAQYFKSEESYDLADVGVYFGQMQTKNNDPYFSGEGPSRTPCTSCGGCMIGCKVGAKNTLDKNYLYFAEKWGVQVIPGLTVQKIEKTTEGYVVTTKQSRNWFGAGPQLKAKKIILSAGVLGTLKILFENKLKYKTLSLVSDRLGENVRTNGESLCGVTSLDDQDYSQGIAIGSSFRIGSNIKIEPVRYPAGSSSMKILAVPLTNEIPSPKILRTPLRMLKMLKNFIFQFLPYLKTHWLKDWARHSVVLLVMQSSDEKMKLGYGRSFLNLFRRGLKNDKKYTSSIPSYIPLAQEAAKQLALQMNGLPQNIISEVALNTPATAHILGGVPNGTTSENGVVDQNFEVFNYPGLYVCDGSIIPVNLGVNPSLTITALAETFTEQFPRLENAPRREVYCS